MKVNSFFLLIISICLISCGEEEYSNKEFQSLNKPSKSKIPKDSFIQLSNNKKLKQSFFQFETPVKKSNSIFLIRENKNIFGINILIDEKFIKTIKSSDLNVHCEKLIIKNKLILDNLSINCKHITFIQKGSIQISNELKITTNKISYNKSKYIYFDISGKNGANAKKLNRSRVISINNSKMKRVRNTCTRVNLPEDCYHNSYQTKYLIAGENGKRGGILNSNIKISKLKINIKGGNIGKSFLYNPNVTKTDDSNFLKLSVSKNIKKGKNGIVKISNSSYKEDLKVSLLKVAYIEYLYLIHADNFNKAVTNNIEFLILKNHSRKYTELISYLKLLKLRHKSKLDFYNNPIHSLNSDFLEVSNLIELENLLDSIIENERTILMYSKDKHFKNWTTLKKLMYINSNKKLWKTYLGNFSNQTLLINNTSVEEQIKNYSESILKKSLKNTKRKYYNENVIYFRLGADELKALNNNGYILLNLKKAFNLSKRTISNIKDISILDRSVEKYGVRSRLLTLKYKFSYLNNNFKTYNKNLKKEIHYNFNRNEFNWILVDNLLSSNFQINTLKRRHNLRWPANNNLKLELIKGIDKSLNTKLTNLEIKIIISED